MPKETKLDELAILRKDNAQLRIENLAFTRLLRSTHNHYEGLLKSLSELIVSIKTAKQDASNLLELLDKREATKKALKETGVQKDGTG